MVIFRAEGKMDKDWMSTCRQNSIIIMQPKRPTTRENFLMTATTFCHSELLTIGCL